MTVRSPAVRPMVAWLLYVGFVVYGSLVPLDWHPLPFDDAWRQFQQLPFLQLGIESRADWVANGVLYVPLGVLGARAIAAGKVGVGAAVGAWLLAAVLAVAVEFTQLQFPPRTVSQNDILAEFIGAALGVALAPRVDRWLGALVQAWGRDPTLLTRTLLAGYIAAYGLYAFFPFDLLLSRSELSAKLTSGHVAWVLAWPEDASALRVGIQLLAEVALTLPLGLALGRRPWLAGLALGAVLGMAIELGQVLVASGVSQGASVATRALGVAAGTWLAGRAFGLPDLRSLLYRHRGPIAVTYLLLLLLVTLGRHRWGGWPHAQASWQELRLMPFYYHYFTTEMVALTSLGATVLMFAPCAALAWASHATAGSAALLAVLLAAAIETARLFATDTHPDPTNLLIAGAAVWLGVHALDALDKQRRAGRAVAPPRTAAPSPAGTLPGGRPSWRQRLPGGQPGQAWVWLVLLPVLLLAATWPAGSVTLVTVLLAAVLATQWLPALALLMVPAAMPVLDLAPWSGRFYVDEFDLLCAGVLGVALARTPPVARDRGASRWAFAALAACLALGASRPLLAQPAWDMNSLSHLYSPFNGLRIAKGALWAGLTALLYRRLVLRRATLARWLHAGVVLGLALTVAVVLWERAAFAGLLNFDADYRVTGPFSVMNKGGAYVECFLAVGLAFLLAEGLRQRGARLLLAGLLVALASYALFVTYSRNGYAALAAAAAVVAVGAWRRGSGRLPALVLLVVAAAAAVPVVGGAFAQQRLASIERDFDARWRHWQLALDLRDPSSLAMVFGTGLGRFPERHAWHARGEPRAAPFRLEPGDGNPFLRLAPGAPTYIEQVVNPPAGQELRLTMNVRSLTQAAPSIVVSLCRKWMLTSSDCETVTVQGVDKAPGVWQTQYADIPPLPAPAGLLQAWAPAKLSLHAPTAGRVIDVDNVFLTSVEGVPLVTNGHFGGGMDRWFFSTDVDPPWHIHSLPVSLLFDLGWVGLLAALAVVGAAAVGGWRAVAAGQLAGTAAAAGLAAFLVSGTLNTLIDEPRFLWLFLMLAWLCVFHGRQLTEGMTERVVGPPRSAA